MSNLNTYYIWLCDLININQRNRSYFLLIKELHRKQFTWFVPNDDNRAFEGKNLRERFCKELNIEYDYEYFPSTASMLELIIALAYRCEEIMIDRRDNMPMVEWFWKLLSNVELDKFTDEDYYDMNGPAFVDDILTRIIRRTYSRNGGGSLFPLRHPKKDQRKVELWYQMNYYLVENYYTEDLVM